jgi:hypothetical protein
MTTLLQQIPVGSANPKGPHQIVTMIDSELTKRHETRGNSSWFDVVLSQIRLHRLRVSSMGACKHHGVLRWSGVRRRAAQSNVDHEGAQGVWLADDNVALDPHGPAPQQATPLPIHPGGHARLHL